MVAVIPLLCRVIERSYRAGPCLFLVAQILKRAPCAFRMMILQGSIEAPRHGTLLRNARGTSPVNYAFRAGSFALKLGEGRSREGNAGEGGINLLELLCKVQFEALGVLV